MNTNNKTEQAKQKLDAMVKEHQDLIKKRMALEDELKAVNYRINELYFNGWGNQTGLIVDARKDLIKAELEHRISTLQQITVTSYYGSQYQYYVESIDAKWIHAINEDGVKYKFKIENGRIAGARDDNCYKINVSEVIK